MRVAALQHDIVWEDPDANFERLAPQVARAAGAGADLVVLTEMYSTGFSMNTEKTAEPVGGPSTQFLVDRAEQHGVWVGGSLPELHEGMERPYNRFVLAGPDGQTHAYSKIHPFTYSGEHEHYAAGDQYVTIDVAGVRVSLFVCYDLRFADEFWALAEETDLYLVPANWPDSRRLHWRTLLRARAIENQAYVVGVNRVGSDPSLEYVGDSAVIDPLGRTIAEASEQEVMLLAEVDPEEVARVRETMPFLPDRRGERA